MLVTSHYYWILREQNFNDLSSLCFVLFFAFAFYVEFFALRSWRGGPMDFSFVFPVEIPLLRLKKIEKFTKFNKSEKFINFF